MGVTEASKFAIDRPSLSCGGDMAITDADFKAALAKVSPSLSAKVLPVSYYVFILLYLPVSSPHVLLFLGPEAREMDATGRED